MNTAKATWIKVTNDPTHDYAVTVNGQTVIRVRWVAGRHGDTLRAYWDGETYLGSFTRPADAKRECLAAYAAAQALYS